MIQIRSMIFKEFPNETKMSHSIWLVSQLISLSYLTLFFHYYTCLLKKWSPVSFHKENSPSSAQGILFVEWKGRPSLSPLFWGETIVDWIPFSSILREACHGLQIFHYKTPNIVISHHKPQSDLKLHIAKHDHSNCTTNNMHLAIGQTNHVYILTSARLDRMVSKSNHMPWLWSSTFTPIFP